MISKIDDVFRGPLMKPLAQNIETKFGTNKDFITPYLIGLAAQDSTLNPQNWIDICPEDEIFQNLKYLWHVLAYHAR